MVNKREVGKKYEDLAKEYLISQGYEIIDANFYTHFGEIDIIAREGDYLVFLEVKYRKTTKYGSPLEAITPRKIKNIRNSAMYYIHSKRVSQFQPIRFDVVAILGEEITLLKNAF